MNWNNVRKSSTGFLALVALISGCGVYNFKGSNIPKEIQTFSVGFFGNEAQLVNPQLGLLFTEKLKTKFQNETRLNLVTTNGDWRFSGAIRDYRIEPSTIDNNTGAAQNQFTITIKVVFENDLNPEQNFNRDFSFFRTFDASKEFSSVENELASEITDNIVQQIFAATALEW